MKLPRDISGAELVKALDRIGYVKLRQKGSHAYLAGPSGSHHVVVPMHSPIKLGTFAGIVTDVAAHLKIEKQELLDRLFS